MKLALLFPPQWYPSQPYLALPTLKAHLESKGHEVDQFDLNIECYDVFLSKEYLERNVIKIAWTRKIGRTVNFFRNETIDGTNYRDTGDIFLEYSRSF